MVRRGSLVVAALLATGSALLPLAPAHGDGVPIVALDGRGFGHGVGLSQWGAKHLADAGASHEDILATFYPGTQIGLVDDPEVRVAVYESPDGRATLTFPQGGQVLSAPSGDQEPGFPIDVPAGGSVVVSHDGAGYHAAPAVTGQSTGRAAEWQAPAPAAAADGGGCIPILGACPPPGGDGSGCGALGCVGSTTTTEPPTTEPPSTTSPPDGGAGGGGGATGGDAPTTTAEPGSTSAAPLWAAPSGGGVVGVAERGRRYRGLIQATAGGGPLRLVDQLDVETYLEGMGEVPGSWPLEAVAAQAVVARTYALRAMAASGELCDYDLCQVYLGADGESPGQNAGVQATTGQVVTYGRALAASVYSADAGGVSATTLEGFGTDDGRYPYLTTVHYDTPDPLPWHADLALTDVAARLGYRGALSSVKVATTGPSGRALTMALDGDSGPATVSGRDFAAALGLRSTLFIAAIGSAATAPAAPDAPTVAVQVLPDDAAAMSAAAAHIPKQEQKTSSRASRAAAAPVPGPRQLAKAVTGIADSPAVWMALALLVVLTAAAVNLWGIDPLALPAEASLALPAWLTRTRRR